ncbi:6-phosphofructokinase [Anaerobium acetethylicum]|uniref:Pyrophosphate--fructose 6-phosphate 1-phosphotransferase n=1 Tax=Anaerobium acetethylicum TaxID=1619234 RepID=A0A1D3TW31_9FIRM|nr:6-phosphofructokinase [Anaerobium acetethylicum]SCP98428.1 6-phosphofructokinase 1 [Anaerobium acetethylicum]
MKSKRNAIVGQSGGPTAVINASLYGVIIEALKNKSKIERIYGMINGIEGFLQNQFIDLGNSLTMEELELLKTTPSAYLSSCRYKLPEKFEDAVFKTLFEKFNELNIGYFYYIGGNDSMDTVSKLSHYAEKIGSDIRFIGIPKTIDNDLVLTDTTPGFGSAAKYVASTISEIILDASVYNGQSVTIVEIMGRHAGWLTAASVLSRKNKGDNPVLIYLPEVSFDFEKFLTHLKKALQKKNNVVICVSEGIKDASGKFICEYTSEAAIDKFGHKALKGCGSVLERIIKERMNIKVRSVELSINQRCSSSLISLIDHNGALEAGRQGVLAGLAGETRKMVAFTRDRINDDLTLSCSLVDVDDVCNKEKLIPNAWILDEGTNISEEFVDYALPLIQGQANIPFENGIPRFVYR